MNDEESHMKQHLTPYFSALKEYASKDRVPLDVPGHKMGAIHNEMVDFLGVNVFKMDVNAPRGLDNLNMPQGVIEESQSLFADAFHADRAFFLTGGTTLGILSIIMTTVKAKEKIIMPRNVHKSIISALIMSGAVPIFVAPHIDPTIGIANHMPYEALKKAIDNNLDAKAVLVINPTYFGVASDIASIVKLAHEHEMLVLADEAHGSHMVFSEQLPMTAMQAGADMSATSIHKTSGSLTQSSAILCKGSRVDYSRLIGTIHMVQSTSPNALMLASLDVARKWMYFNAQDTLSTLLTKLSKLRNQLNDLPGIKVFDANYFTSLGATAYDETKLIIQVSGLGMTGFEVYRMLADDYDIQVELAESNLVLCVFAVGTTDQHIQRLYEALEDMTLNHKREAIDIASYRPKGEFPKAFVRPRSAYHAPSKFVKLEEAVGEIAAESVMIYPPGIPTLIPGEIIEASLIDDIHYYIKQGSTIINEAPDGMIKVVDKNEWQKLKEMDDEL
jgi:arginine decarboxylase